MDSFQPLLATDQSSTERIPVARTDQAEEQWFSAMYTGQACAVFNYHAIIKNIALADANLNAPAVNASVIDSHTGEYGNSRSAWLRSMFSSISGVTSRITKGMSVSQGTYGQTSRNAILGSEAAAPDYRAPFDSADLDLLRQQLKMTIYDDVTHRLSGAQGPSTARVNALGAPPAQIGIFTEEFTPRDYLEMTRKYQSKLAAVQTMAKDLALSESLRFGTPSAFLAGSAAHATARRLAQLPAGLHTQRQLTGVMEAQHLKTARGGGGGSNFSESSIGIAKRLSRRFEGRPQRIKQGAFGFTRGLASQVGGPFVSSSLYAAYTPAASGATTTHVRTNGSTAQGLKSVWYQSQPGGGRSVPLAGV